MRRAPDDDQAEWIGRALDRHAVGRFRYALMLVGDSGSGGSPEKW